MSFHHYTGDVMKRKKDIFKEIDELISSVKERFDEIFEKMEREFTARPLFNVEKCCLEPLVEVHETEDEVIVTADLPFVRSKRNIDLYIGEKHLEIKASIDKPITFDDWDVLHKHPPFKFFYKVVDLPTEVEAREAKAYFRNGILKIVIPKKIRGFKIHIK